MNIGSKVKVGSGAFLALLLMAGASGLLGVHNLTQSLHFISGPAWESADSSMEVAIAIQKETLALERFALGSHDLNTTRAKVSQAKAEAENSLKRLRAAGLMSDSEVLKLENLANEYHRASAKILQQELSDGNVDKASLRELDDSANKLMEHLEILESNGSSKILSIKNANEATVDSAYFWVFFSVVLGLIASVAIHFGAEQIVRQIKNIVASLADLAQGEGDLRARLKTSSKDEIGELAGNFNRFLEKLGHSIAEITKVNATLVQAVEEMDALASHNLQTVERQAQQISLIASATHQMDTTSHSVADNAESCSSATQEALQRCNQSRSIMGENVKGVGLLSGKMSNTTQVVDKLLEDSKTIGGVLEVIKSIAEQTNLLALNAAIEAARAGEQGRGFAVVADEVRTLAQRTQSSTAEIEDMISRLQQQAQTAASNMSESQQQTLSVVDGSNNADKALQQVLTAMDTISQMNIQISSAAEEQSVVASEISNNTSQLLHLSDETSAAAAQTKQIGDRLKAMGASLNKVASGFRVGN